MNERDTATHETTAQTMSALLGLVNQCLKARDVKKVGVQYVGGEFIFAYVLDKDNDVPKSIAALTAIEIRKVLLNILTRRFPDALTNKDANGFFEWDLGTDTLVHEHHVTHHGI